MPTEKTYDRILAYLKGLLSHRQRHSLEKDMMQDVFEEEAFEGLSQLSGSNFENDMELLQKRLDVRINPAKKNQLTLFLRLAAAIALLIGVGSMLYFVFRTPTADLITEEHKMEKPAVPSVPPSNVVQPQSGIEKPGKPEQEKKIDIRRQTVQAPTENLTESKEEFMSQPAAVQEKKEVRELDIPAADEVERSRALMKTASTSVKPRKVYSGIVLDNAGEILPGVIVTEMGTNNGTVTDANGKFNLPLQDTNSRLTLNFIGYKSVELETAEKPKDKIVMEEDLVALNEVVVVGYATQTKNSITGAVSTIDFDEDSKQRQTDQTVLTKPIPPGGSLKGFKRWVYDRLDYKAYKDYPGKYRITAVLTVHANGTISDIRIKEGPPDKIAADLKMIISQSSLWTAALKDDNPVNADIEIHFVITVE